jgi:hypothetical protein
MERQCNIPNIDLNTKLVIAIYMRVPLEEQALPTLPEYLSSPRLVGFMLMVL